MSSQLYSSKLMAERFRLDIRPGQDRTSDIFPVPYRRRSFGCLPAGKDVCIVIFQDKYGSHYSEAKTEEKNRERYEYRTVQSYSDPAGYRKGALI